MPETDEDTAMWREALRLAGLTNDDIRDVSVVRDHATDKPVRWLIMLMNGRRYELTPDGKY